jgi:hypothetical protein
VRSSSRVGSKPYRSTDIGATRAALKLLYLHILQINGLDIRIGIGIGIFNHHHLLFPSTPLLYLTIIIVIIGSSSSSSSNSSSRGRR